MTSNVILPLNQLVTIAGVGGTQANPNPPSPFDGSFIVLSSAPGSFVIAAAGGPSDGAGTVTVNPAPPFPITATAFQPHFGGGSTDAFVMKISATGSGILYSSYLGGESEDVGNGIAVDKNNDAYVTGLTDSDASATTAERLSSDLRRKRRRVFCRGEYERLGRELHWSIPLSRWLRT